MGMQLINGAYVPIATLPSTPAVLHTSAPTPATKINGIPVDSSSAGDNKSLVYSSGELVFQDVINTTRDITTTGTVKSQKLRVTSGDDTKYVDITKTNSTVQITGSDGEFYSIQTGGSGSSITLKTGDGGNSVGHSGGNAGDFTINLGKGGTGTFTGASGRFIVNDTNYEDRYIFYSSGNFSVNKPEGGFGVTPGSHLIIADNNSPAHYVNLGINSLSYGSDAVITVPAGTSVSDGVGFDGSSISIYTGAGGDGLTPGAGGDFTINLGAGGNNTGEGSPGDSGELYIYNGTGSSIHYGPSGSLFIAGPGGTHFVLQDSGHICTDQIATNRGLPIYDTGDVLLCHLPMVPATTLLDGLNAFYPFDGLKDTSGNGHEFLASPQYIAAVIGKLGLGFTSTNGGGASNMGVFDGGPSTISFWGINTGANPLTVNLIGLGLVGSVTIKFTRVDESNTNVNILTSAGTYDSGSLDNSVWYHIVCTIEPEVGGDGSNSIVNLYINGSLAWSGGSDMVQPGVFNTTMNSGCALCQLGFWTRVLTSDEIAALYNSGNGFDPTR